MGKSGYIKRQYLHDQLTAEIEKASKHVIQGDSPSYEIGQALGYSDGLKAARDLLQLLPDEEPPEPQRAWHHSKR
ncbi:MAG: hypothetical protein ACI4ME_09710 [Aristaeellaceae bacterium]